MMHKFQIFSLIDRSSSIARSKKARVTGNQQIKKLLTAIDKVLAACISLLDNESVLDDTLNLFCNKFSIKIILISQKNLNQPYQFDNFFENQRINNYQQNCWDERNRDA